MEDDPMDNDPMDVDISEEASEPPSSNTGTGPLPACVWAKNVWGYLFHDELLRCTILSAFFLREVCPLITRLLISPRAGSNTLAFFPSKRFPEVSDVYLYNIILEVWKIHEHGRWAGHSYQDFDICSENVLSNVVPFLSTFANLEYVFLGGTNTTHCDNPIFNKDFIRVETRVSDSYRHLDLLPANEHEKIANFVMQICAAYKRGYIDSKVNFDGVLSEHRLRVCAWRSDENQPCCLCHQLCHFYPVSQVMKFTRTIVPCLTEQEQVDILLTRNTKLVKENVTNSFIEALSDTLTEYCGSLLRAISYEHKLDKLRILAELGADVTDPRVREKLLSFEAKLSFLPDRPVRGITRESFKALVAIGVDISTDDFYPVDPRPLRVEDYLYDKVDEAVWNAANKVKVNPDEPIESYLQVFRQAINEHKVDPRNKPGKIVAQHCIEAAIKCDIAIRWTILEIIAVLAGERLISSSDFEHSVEIAISDPDIDKERLPSILGQLVYVGLVSIPFICRSCWHMNIEIEKEIDDASGDDLALIVPAKYDFSMKLVKNIIDSMIIMFGVKVTKQHFESYESNMALEVYLGTPKWNSTRVEKLGM